MITTKSIKVNLDKRSYQIVIGNNIIDQLPVYLAKIAFYSKIFIISDENIAKLHLEKLLAILTKSGLDCQTITLAAGEKTKDFHNLQNLCEQILQNNADRKSLIIAFGGGVIGDLCGFAASIILRGIDFVQIPTTLLAAVDSSVGGKTAINSRLGKNLIGSFYQPKLVFCDINYISTLNNRELLSGYAEVLKYGLIKDKLFFEYLDQNYQKLQSKDIEFMANIIAQSCELKAEIVALDEKENDIRALLNFGHTFGHIFEAETDYSKELIHGEAVAIGMMMATKMSENLGILKKSHDFVRISEHFKKVGLTSSPKLVRKNWNMNNLIVHLYKDKKTENKNLTFILLEEIGQAIIKKNIDETDFVRVTKQFIN